MNDIAVEAGIARQTLYNRFKNKDEVLQATIRLVCDEAIEAIGKKNREALTLDEKLDVVFEHITIRPYEHIHQSPNTEDIIEGFNAAGQAEIATAYDRYRRVLEELLTPYAQQADQANIQIADLAEFITLSAKSAKTNARDRAHLDQLLGTLKAATLAIIGPKD